MASDEVLQRTAASMSASAATFRRAAAAFDGSCDRFVERLRGVLEEDRAARDAPVETTLHKCECDEGVGFDSATRICVGCGGLVPPATPASEPGEDG